MSAERIAQLEAQVEKLLSRTAHLEERVEELETENGRLRADNRRLKRENRKLRDENRWLRREVRRLGGNPEPPPEERTPPSEDEKEDTDEKPAKGPPGDKDGKRRKRGAQPGHEPNNREPFPPERVDRVVVVKPEACAACGAKLSGDDPCPRRHQVAELPEPKAVVTEHQLHALNCKKCGEVTQAALPDGVPAGAFGPKLQAFVGLLTGGYRLSKRAAQELLQDVCGVTMSLGSVSACEHAVSHSLEAPYAEALKFAQEQTRKGADETGWRENGAKAYLWVVVTAMVTVFAIRARRTKEVAQELLGSVVGILTTDRFSAYLYWPVRRHQFCWAHLKRRFEEFLLSDETAQRVGKLLLVEVRLIFERWYRIRDGTLSRAAFQRLMRPLRRRVKALLLEGEACTDPEIAGTCRELLEYEPALWAFVFNEGVEPTSNEVERELRHGVLYRKGCFGTQSQAGSRFVERLLTARATLRRQKRSVIRFLTEACQTALTGAAPPSLLPQAAHQAERSAAA
jgi:transposase